MALTQAVAREAFEHTQTVASDTWVIVHNFNAYPIIDTYVDFEGGLHKMLPLEVGYTDENTVTVTFSEPQTGRALIV